MKPFRSMRLKQETSTNLDDALAASAAGDLSVGAAAYSSGRGAKVYQVEDVGYLAAKLEPHALIYGEIAEKRGIDVLVARHVELCGTLVAKHARRTEACTTGIDAGSAIDRRIEPLCHLRRTSSFDCVRNLARNNARAVVAEAREVIVDAGGDGQWLTAVRRPDAGDRPAVQSSLHNAVIRIEVVRLPDEGHRHHMAAVLVRTLAVFKLREIGIHKDAVEATGAVEGVALQRVAPTVVALRADVMCDALVHNNLQAVVVGVLIGFDDPDVAVHRAGCRRTVVVNAAVEGTAVVDRTARIGIAACLGQVSTAGPRNAGRCDVELRSVDIVVDWGLAVQ